MKDLDGDECKKMSGQLVQIPDLLRTSGWVQISFLYRCTDVTSFYLPFLLLPSFPTPSSFYFSISKAMHGRNHPEEIPSVLNGRRRSSSFLFHLFLHPYRGGEENVGRHAISIVSEAHLIIKARKLHGRWEVYMYLPFYL